MLINYKQSGDSVAKLIDILPSFLREAILESYEFQRYEITPRDHLLTLYALFHNKNPDSALPSEMMNLLSRYPQLRQEHTSLPRAYKLFPDTQSINQVLLEQRLGSDAVLINQMLKKKGQKIFDEYRVPLANGSSITERHELDYKLLSTLMSMLLTLLTEEDKRIARLEDICDKASVITELNDSGEMLEMKSHFTTRFLEQQDLLEIDGWCYYPDRIDNSVTVDLFCNGFYIDSTKSNQFRQDLHSAGIAMDITASGFKSRRDSLPKGGLLSLIVSETGDHLDGSPCRNPVLSKLARLKVDPMNIQKVLGDFSGLSVRHLLVDTNDTCNADCIYCPNPRSNS